jgi:hypothetical protein
VGWGHHHWIVEPTGNRLDFVFKHHVICGRESDHLPDGFADTLSAEDRVMRFWWEDTFEFGERIFVDSEELDAYLADYVKAHAPDRPPARPAPKRRRPLASLLRRR